MPDPHPDPASQTLSTGEQARPALTEALGGKRGLLDSGLPAAVFVSVNAVVTAFSDARTGLRAAIVAAVLVGLVVVLVRLRRRETVQQAIGGFLGLAVAAVFAARSGEARDFFLPGILFNLAYSAAFVVSALLGRPLVGYVYAAVGGLDGGWRGDQALRRAMAVASIGWAAVFALRAVVQGALYLADRPGLLAAARLLMGWPVTIAAVALTVAFVRSRRRRLEPG